MASVLETDVVIAGGGLAGLTTAVGLRESGLRVVVVERDAILRGPGAELDRLDHRGPGAHRAARLRERLGAGRTGRR